MYRSSLRAVAALLMAGATCLPAIAATSVTSVGNPTFEVVDFHMFAAPIGTVADGLAEFSATQTLLLPPPGHVSNPTLGIGPGAAHAGPYDHEMGQGVAANGFIESSSFSMAQYSNGNGVYLVFMIVPGAGSATGKSPDFAAGPIMANGLFPMTFDGATLTNGVQNDVLGVFSVPALNTVSGFENVDGHSHIPLFFADSIEFAERKVGGDYEYRISILDAAGNGYDIRAPFSVQAVPEPASTVLLLAGGAFLISIRRRYACPRMCRNGSTPGSHGPA